MITPEPPPPAYEPYPTSPISVQIMSPSSPTSPVSSSTADGDRPSAAPITALVSGQIHPLHRVLLLVGCLFCLASFAFCCVAVASPYLYTASNDRTTVDQDNTYTASAVAHIGAFWYVVCTTSTDSGDDGYSSKTECDNNAGTAFVVDTGKATTVRVLTILSCVATLLSTVLILARTVRFLWQNQSVYAARWDRVLLVLLSVSSIVLLVTVALVGSIDVTSLISQWLLLYQQPVSSKLGTAFALLVVALVMSVLVLAWYGWSYWYGVLSLLQQTRGQSSAAREEQDIDLAGVTLWSTHPWHKLPLLSSVLSCMVTFALLVAVLVSTSLYTAAAHLPLNRRTATLPRPSLRST